MKTFARWLSIALLGTAMTAPITDAQMGTLYNGSGCNPVTFQNVHGPFVGEPWLSRVARPPGRVSVLLLGLGPAQPGWRPGGVFGAGELLILPPLTRLDLSISGQHSVLIPADASLIGQVFCVQAAICGAKAREIGQPAAGLGTLELQNAWILTILQRPSECTEFTCGG